MFVGQFKLKTAPENEESLASWLVRISHQFVLKPYAFCLIMWRGTTVLTRDIDGQSNPAIWKRLAEANGISEAEAYSTTISSLEGKLFSRHSPNSKTRWVLRLGVFHRSRRRFGQQYCPHCLATESTPNYHLKWRLAFSTVCLKHRCVLLDHCASCGSAVEFHRTDPYFSTIVECFHCRARLDKQNTSRAPSDVIKLQSHLESALSRGTISIGRTISIPSVELFAIYGQLVRIVATGTRSQQLRNTISTKFGFDPSPINFETGAKEYEALTISSRLRLARLCSPLLLEWPNTFVDVCRKSDFWASWAMRDFHNAPEEYKRVVLNYIRGPKIMTTWSTVKDQTQISRFSPRPSHPTISARKISTKINMPLTNHLGTSHR